MKSNPCFNSLAVRLDDLYVCVAPPIVVGAWPMAGMLWRLFEYYYYYAL